MLIDTHCHLDWKPLDADLGGVLDRARQAGVKACVTVGCTVESSRASVALAKNHSMLRASVGIHPEDAYAATEPAFRAIEALAADPVVAAIGEVGLDYYHMAAPRDVQQQAFERFIRMAKRAALPIIIHCRDAGERTDAYDDLLRCLYRAGSRPMRGVIHCASGPKSYIQGALELGFYISFAGNVTYPKAQPLRDLVALVPDDRLLVETDSPFLAPQPVRGQTNEPAHVAHTAEFLASLRGTTKEALAQATTTNATTLFRFH